MSEEILKYFGSKFSPFYLLNQLISLLNHILFEILQSVHYKFKYFVS